MRVLSARAASSQGELLTMLEEEELKDAALIVFANKQDLPNAQPSDVIAEKLGLASLKVRHAAGRGHPRPLSGCGSASSSPPVLLPAPPQNRQWSIFKTSALKGDGLYDGLDWLVNTLREGK